MTDVDKAVRQHLRGLADRVAPEGEERVMNGLREASSKPRHGLREASSKPRRRTAVAMGIGAAAAIAVVAAATLGGGSTEPQQTGTRADESQVPLEQGGEGIEEVDTVGTPCPGAKHSSTITGLAADVPILAPSAGELTDAWTCAGTPFLMYGDIQVSYEAGWDGVDVNQKWADLARDTGGRVATIGGHPAYIHPPTTDGPRSSVMLVVNGTLIRLLAEGTVPVDDLVKLAESIQLP